MEEQGVDFATMSNAPKPADTPGRPVAAIVWSAMLLLWFVGLSVVPDPRPLSAPEWSVNAVRSVAGVSEPMARAASTLLLRGVGVAMIGVLMALALGRWRYAVPVLLLAAPLVAILAKRINFGYVPILPQLQFIVVLAIMGALVGLTLRRNLVAPTVLVGLCVALAAWGAATGVPDDLYEAARATGLHLLENAESVPTGDDAFASLIESAFAYAEDNSHGTSPMLPNRAAILALGTLLGEDKVARIARRPLEPGSAGERASLRRRPTIHGRNDLSRHFWVSAALTVLSDANRSLAVGIAKEVKDSTPGGSGFSFVDMAANKAGIRFAVVATRSAESARSLQLRIAQGVNPGDFVPEISGLAEGMSQETFQSDYGGLGGAETRRLFSEIDRRVSACPGLQ